MKTLTQVEPRTPVLSGSAGIELDQNGGYLITASGSYYLDGNIVVASGNALTIVAPDVTLDLNGFTILSTAGDNTVRGAGIEIAGGVTNVTIRHGHIRGTSTLVDSTFTPGGFDYGINARNTTGNILVEDVGVVGIVQSGISLPQSSVASHCAASVCGIGGINAQVVRDCVAEQCVLVGITAKSAENCRAKGAMAGLLVETAVNCRGECTGSFNGLSADESVSNCIGVSDGGIGILCKAALNSRGESRLGTGLSAATATGCFGRSTESTGLRAVNASNSQGLSTRGIGLEVNSTASGCHGSTASGTNGLVAREAAENCEGQTYSGTGIALSTGTALNCNAYAADGTALIATTATNCHGKSSGSGTGLSAETATGCFGESNSGIGLSASMAFNCSAYTGFGANAMSVVGTANSCRGNNGGTGNAISAAIAIGCTSYHGAIVAPQKFLGTP